MFTLTLEPLRDVLTPIDRIINAVISLASMMFRFNSQGSLANQSWFRMLVDTIVGKPYLLISLSLVLCGFVVSILGRLIRT